MTKTSDPAPANAGGPSDSGARGDGRRRRRRAKSARGRPVVVRNTEPRDFPGIIELCQAVYRRAVPYTEETLASQRSVFPDGQLVAVDPDSDRVLGTAMSLVIRWDDYGFDTDWNDFTGGEMFTNHDPGGRTLYGAEVMVHPETQGRGVGKKLYAARRDLCRRLGLIRIRAGGRLRHYHRHADRMTAEEYVLEVIAGELSDPTLTFQLKQGFRVLAVVGGYVPDDPESLGWAAVIEWLNHQIARPKDFWRRSSKFARHRKRR